MPDAQFVPLPTFPMLVLPTDLPARAVVALQAVAVRRAELGARQGELQHILDECIVQPDFADRQDLLTIAAALLMAIERFDQAADALLAPAVAIPVDARPCDTEPPEAA